MRRLYIDPDEFALEESAELRLVGARARRVREVLRAPAGATISVFDGSGGERSARITSMNRGEVVLTLGGSLPSAPEPPVPVAIACTFPRAGRADWLVEKATEIGVAQLVPLEADRSALVTDDGRLERWRRIAVESAEQCGRARIPLVGGPPPGDELEIVGDPDSDLTIRQQLARLTEPPSVVMVHIGPETGWLPADLEVFDARGALRCSMGPRLMRVETAAIVAATQLLELTGGLDPMPTLEA